MAEKQIMIVDDSSIMRRVISDLIAAESSLVVCAQAKDGEDALHQLRQANPDLILLDIEMPHMNGLEFLRHAKLRSRAKIIVLSSVTGLGSEKAEEAIRLGADAIVSKPSGAVSVDLKDKCGRQITAAVKKVLSMDRMN